MRDSRCFTVTLFDRHNSEFEATQTSPAGGFSLGTYRVSLRDHTCDCGYFQALHYPCMHDVACCARSRVSWASYVHDVYRMTEVFSVYRIGFAPPIPEGYWPPHGGPSSSRIPVCGEQGHCVLGPCESGRTWIRQVGHGARLLLAPPWA
ncbi:hypothetical protein PIB30_008713 [Stylosanthes scabra]|uniref:SWIM-type domain-containing protein n=1 Tax=Stylosanthes scabra TaxID=79078 RepID=A0ABU6U3Y6_9FABA|nr:hypothetical protein [Stylosanthes scabra]